MSPRILAPAAAVVVVLGSWSPVLAETVARSWNEQNLDAIRLSFPDPPVHARNLFHVSVAMYDAWAAYDNVAVGYIHNENAVAPGTIADARHEAISYAAYKVLISRYVTYPHPKTPVENAAVTKTALDAKMAEFGYPTGTTTITGTTPAAVGNRVATAIIVYAWGDGSRESSGYDDPTYTPVNDPLIIELSGTTLADPNRWQPLAFEFAVTQNGVEADEIQTFIGAHWGDVRPFALHHEAGETIYHDPGAPPLFGGVGDADFKSNNVEVIRFSSWLDPDDGVMVDCSPNSYGDNTLGFNDGSGYVENPVTESPYSPVMVKRADFGRVLAEFWADGPDSETPPGHWNTLANQVVEDPSFVAKIEGEGAVLDPLEWDVKMYFPINAAVHDVAVSIWGCKRVYDYVRPISSIRYLGGENLLPLESGLVEIITVASSAAGQRHEHLAAYEGDTAIYAWGGEPDDPENEYTGAEWILAGDWLPYQRDTFVTPAFAGYVSGHSGFSRAAAEVLTAMTGSPYFPGGLGSHTVLANSLQFEKGPSTDVTLQWCSYYDAADQAGISRLYGGIHVAPDDGPGRIMGSEIGKAAWELAKKYYDGSIATHSAEQVAIVRKGNGDMELTWWQNRGMFYGVSETLDLETGETLMNYQRAETDQGLLLIPAGTLPAGKNFYQVLPSVTGE